MLITDIKVKKDEARKDVSSDGFQHNLRSFNDLKESNQPSKTNTQHINFLESLAPNSPTINHPKYHKQPIFKKIIQHTAYIVVGLCIVFILPGLLKASLDTEFPLASIISDSMNPTLKAGDIVFIKGVSAAEEVSEGEIVLWKNRESGNFVIHRVVEIENNIEHIHTRGDALTVPDPPISMDEIVGKTALWPEPFPWAGSPVRIPVIGNISSIVKK